MEFQKSLTIDIRLIKKYQNLLKIPLISSYGGQNIRSQNIFKFIMYTDISMRKSPQIFP